MLADALRLTDEDAATAVENEADWRKQYPRHIAALVRQSIEDPRAARRIATSGLDSLHGRLTFRDRAGERPLNDAMADPTGPAFETETLRGSAAPVSEIAVPYRGADLRGRDLVIQAERWLSKHIIEYSCAEAIVEAVEHPEWFDLSDLTVVCIGAGAEMGPFDALLGLGAEIVAVDLPGSTSRLRDAVAAGASTVHLPMRGGVVGADLTQDAPELLAWLGGFDGPLMVGGYAYADGEAHVRVAATQDAVLAGLARHDEHAAVAIAHLLTPTDVYAVPAATAEVAQQRWSDRAGGRRRAQSVVSRLSGGSVFNAGVEELIDGKDGYRAAVRDALIIQQGPNYALAKRLQEWRAMVAREQGVRVSVNVAPATRTHSVTKNRALAMAFGGAHRFGIEVFEPNTSNALMALLLVRDMRTLTGPADPHVTLTNPLELFSDGAAHGGLWSTPFEPRSVFGVAALAGLPQLVKR